VHAEPRADVDEVEFKDAEIDAGNDRLQWTINIAQCKLQVCHALTRIEFRATIIVAQHACVTHAMLHTAYNHCSPSQ